MLQGEDAMRSHDKGAEASAQLNALRRLTVKPHANTPPSGTHKGYRIRLYDGDRVVGYVPVPNVLLMITISAVLWALIYLAMRW
jgi:ribosomal protein S12